MPYSPKDDMKGRSNSKSEIDRYLGVTNLKPDQDAQHAKLGKGQGGRKVDNGNGAANRK